MPNPYFAKQCSLINNESKISSNLPDKKDKLLPNVMFSVKDIGKIIQNLNYKFVTPLSVRPPEIIYKSCLERDFRDFRDFYFPS